MQEFEKLGVFYLGRPYDLPKKQPKNGWLLYDSKDLVTHAVCVGMTGSGKTGLCLALLEEAAIDGIPAILIDPKGDLGNLLLTFPNLAAQDFLPWINEDDARKKGQSAAEYAAAQAELWKKGLSAWQQDGPRIARLRDAADFTIYTPGSQAGMPVSILRAFSAPAQEIREDEELFQEHITSTVTALLGLIGVHADPVQSPPHILISTILDAVWRNGQNLDLVPLIQQIQTPPFSRLGAMELDDFYPARERFALAKNLNSLIAAPGFKAWMEGAPLDVDGLLHTPDGKPRISIMSIAHLNDDQRMFFVSLLLNQMLAWTRKQSGTTSLRAILYMDEIFGYFPPVKNPPSKQPLLTLLKQARAYGVGVVLATQNPVDLDYKGLANTGTWFIGRLQTERDKARVLEGLEGASAAGGGRFDRQQTEALLAALGQRIFLMNNVHEDEPIVFETRWCLSYLRGPLTRTQIKTLMESRKAAGGDTAIESGVPSQDTAPAPAAPKSATAANAGGDRPLLAPEIAQYFVRQSTHPTGTGRLVYRPMLIGSAQIRYLDSKSGIDTVQERTFLTPLQNASGVVEWNDGTESAIRLDDLQASPAGPAQYAPLPPAAGKPKSYQTWNKEFALWLSQTQRLEVWKSPQFNRMSNPGESERDFRVRLQQVAREQRDDATDRLRKSYAPKTAALQERLRRAEQARQREAEQAKAAHIQTAISVGATILGAFLGRKTLSATSLGRASSAARGVGRSIKEAQDAARAGETIEALKSQLQELEAEFKREADAVAAKMDPLTERLEPVTLKPNKSNIAVKLVGLVWVPS
jgi:hypothetical protein